MHWNLLLMDEGIPTTFHLTRLTCNRTALAPSAEPTRHPSRSKKSTRRRPSQSSRFSCLRCLFASNESPSSLQPGKNRQTKGELFPTIQILIAIDDCCISRSSGRRSQAFRASTQPIFLFGKGTTVRCFLDWLARRDAAGRP